jgi:hypothetical protein
MSGLKENDMSDEVLAADITKNPEPSNISQVFRLLQKFFNTYLIFKFDLEQGKQGERIQDLDVPRKV